MLEEWIRGSQKGEESKESPDWNKWTRYLLALVVCIGLLALIWPAGKSEPAKVSAVSGSQSNLEQSEDQMSRELEAILSQIDGAGQVGVSITLSSNGQKKYASNSKNEVRETSEKDNGTDRMIREENQSSDIAVSGSAALLVEEEAPVVVGVLVVAQGAGDAAVKEELTTAAATLLNIPEHQISVVPRKEE